MGVDNSRNPLIDRVMGSKNEAARVIGFMDFRKEVEDGGVGFGDVNEGYVLEGKAMEGASVLKENEEGLVVDFGTLLAQHQTAVCLP